MDWIGCFGVRLTDRIGRHGESWREWILENIDRGCAPRDMLLRMVSDGVWTESDAQAALNQGLEQKGRAVPPVQLLPMLPPDRHISVDGHVVEVFGRSRAPYAAMLGQVLSEHECDALLDYAFSRGLKQSGVVDHQSGDSVQHRERTSTGVFFTRAETPLIAAIEERLSTLTHWPITHAEGLQVLHYQIGQEYKPHNDWFDTRHQGSALHLARGGQRVATTVMYLLAPEQGGATTFPQAGLEFSPPRGGAVFFRNLTVNGQPDPLTLHAGAPVERGRKVVMTYWQREQEFR